MHISNYTHDVVLSVLLLTYCTLLIKFRFKANVYPFLTCMRKVESKINVFHFLPKDCNAALHQDTNLEKSFINN